MLAQPGPFLMVDSECRLTALIMYYVLLIGLAILKDRMSACVIICGCVLPGLGLLLMVDSQFVGAVCPVGALHTL